MNFTTNIYRKMNGCFGADSERKAAKKCPAYVTSFIMFIMLPRNHLMKLNQCLSVPSWNPGMATLEKFKLVNT